MLSERDPNLPGREPKLPGRNPKPAERIQSDLDYSH